jgi:hypothetical protein
MKSRRKARIKRKAAKKGVSLIVKIFLPILLVLGALFFLALNTKYWNGKDKFIFVSRIPDGGARVSVLDPKLDEETNLTIPGDTEVEVARNYGTLRLKNVWQLAVNEKIPGVLIAETISQNFLFPVFLYKDESIKKTNIPLGDALFIKFFTMGVKAVDRSEIDLAKSQFLQKARLRDGQAGYKLSGSVSESLTAYFSDYSFAGGDVRVGINDATGRPAVAQKVGEIIEVVGGKVVVVNRKTTSEEDCVVSGKNSKTVKKIAGLFSCSIGNQKSDYDIELSLGQKFARRF